MGPRTVLERARLSRVSNCRAPFPACEILSHVSVRIVFGRAGDVARTDAGMLQDGARPLGVFAPPPSLLRYPRPPDLSPMNLPLPPATPPIQTSASSAAQDYKLYEARGSPAVVENAQGEPRVDIDTFSEYSGRREKPSTPAAAQPRCVKRRNWLWPATYRPLVSPETVDSERASEVGSTTLGERRGQLLRDRIGGRHTCNVAGQIPCDVVRASRWRRRAPILSESSALAFFFAMSRGAFLLPY